MGRGIPPFEQFVRPALCPFFQLIGIQGSRDVPVLVAEDLLGKDAIHIGLL
jgi:hypothetical protein